MNLLANIRETINRIFNSYQENGKKFYSVSLVLSLLSSIFAALVSALVCLLTLNIIGVHSESQNIIDRFYDFPISILRFSEISKAVIILNLGLYSIFLLNEESNGIQAKYNFKNFLSKVPGETWNNYALLLAILLITNGLLFRDPFNSPDDTDGILGSLDFFNNRNSGSTMLKFYDWLNSALNLIKTYLPYFLAMVLVYLHLNKKENRKEMIKYKHAFLSALILSFCIHTLSNSVISYIDIYIIELIRIPFIDAIAPTLIAFSVGILLAAYFYLGFASVLAYPFKIEMEKLSMGEINIASEEDIPETE